MTTLVIVESPTKAKTINKYLGQDYDVVASFGHVRDLPSKKGSVDPAQDFAMNWEVDTRSQKHLKALIERCKHADRLCFATDPDREGEAIAWHLSQELERRKLLHDKAPQRVVFHEITKTAVLEALKTPRTIDNHLVHAYLARRALDYLVGFTLSPVLWTKLPGAKSAGRVQSVALKLVCVRESEIEAHRPQEYWSLPVACRTAQGEEFKALPHTVDGKTLKRLSLESEDAALALKARILSTAFAVQDLDTKTVKRHPSPPFTTSTLQQEAGRKLGFNTTQTMKVAQQLYEGIAVEGENTGLITYMRTDSTQISQDAIGQIRQCIGELFGARYVPSVPRAYKTKTKNAQEAHEAIRPTQAHLTPQRLEAHLTQEQLRLYTLIWKRTLASQMPQAEYQRVSATLGESAQADVTLRAVGSVVTFDGFMKLYLEDKDDQEGEDEGGGLLPPMKTGEAITVEAVDPAQHFTQPPPRYSEASLVKKMEELGIGRPSTYASILKVIQDRAYVRLDKRRFIAEDRGRVVAGFLENFFQKYVDYYFTADLEEQLDSISRGQQNWKDVLARFWGEFEPRTTQIKELPFAEVIASLDATLGDTLLKSRSADADIEDFRLCPACKNGRLKLNLGQFGVFFGCSSYPECRHVISLREQSETQGENLGLPKTLGTDPDNGEIVSLRKGPYGLYVQRAPEASPEPDTSTKTQGKKQKPPAPKRASLTKDLKPGDVTMEIALRLLSLPRDIGPHPETREPILAGIGRYGPYLKLGSRFINLKESDDVYTIGMNRAMEVIATAGQKNQGTTLGNHPEDGEPVVLLSGRYGPYVKHNKTNASLPKGAQSVTLDEALELIKARKAAPRRPRAAPRRARR